MVANLGVHSIISYMKKQSLPVLSDVNKDNIQAFKSANKVVVIAFDQGTCIDNEWKHTFTSVAHSLRNEDSLLFGFTDDPELATTEGLTRGAGIVLYKQSDGDKIVYSGKLDKEAVESFINQASLPLLDEVDKYLVEGYAKVS
jgi:protein disulfide-isomerase A1